MTLLSGDTRLSDLPAILNPGIDMLTGTPWVNAQAYGAVGDNSTDATEELQAAIDAARTIGGPASIYLPSGIYLISDTLTLNDDGFPAGQGIRFIGAGTSNPDPGASRPQSVIRGNFSGPLIKRDSATGEGGFSFEHLGFRNTHVTGEGISLTDIQGSSGVSNCWFQTNKGISLLNNTFNANIRNSTFQPGTAGQEVGSWGIYTNGHTVISGVDAAGFDHALRISGPGNTISGARIETSRTGIMLGQDENGDTSSCDRASVHGISMEANDTGINIHTGSSVHIAGVGIHGSANSPSVGSLVGIQTGETYSTTLIGINESGTHSDKFFKQMSGSHNMTLLSVWSTGDWTVSSSNDHIVILNCVGGAGCVNRVELPVIATASLPAAGTANDGQAVIEDAGAGDRNLIVYAGGERFRIDGGSTF